MVSQVDERRALLADWLDALGSFNGGTLSVASADASFRRYFRLRLKGETYIAMDAPPNLEVSHPFVEIGEWMKSKGIQVPVIFAKDLTKGFMVLSDFGDFHFQDALQNQPLDFLYGLAIEEIVKMQSNLLDAQNKLPGFDQSWQNKELDIFREWCLSATSQEEYLESTDFLVQEIDQIPKAFMHRDFHCRNLLMCSEQELGIIDFQGAMHGPVTYDLVSLLRDCYVDNNSQWIDQQVMQFHQRLQSSNLVYAQASEEQFLRWFDLSGLQRHLKCVGIFHRLKMRDNKPEYIRDIPRILRYIHQVIERQPGLENIKQLVDKATILK